MPLFRGNQSVVSLGAVTAVGAIGLGKKNSGTVQSTGSEDHNIVRRLVACLSTWRVVFDSRPVYVRFVFDKAAQGQVLRVLRFFPVDIVSHLLHTHLRLHVDLTRRTHGDVPRAALGRNREALDRKLLSLALTSCAECFWSDCSLQRDSCFFHHPGTFHLKRGCSYYLHAPVTFPSVAV